MSAPLVPDAFWEAIEPLLPEEPPKPKDGSPRVPDRAAPGAAVAAWVARRNAAGAAVDWRFTTADSRIMLKRLYPAIHD